MRLVKRIAIGVACVPVFLFALFVAYELIGMVVNHIATSMQTSRLEKTLEKELPGVEILGSYSETGNTSGTGNHVDMLSVVLFRTELERDGITRRLEPFFRFTDGWSCWIADAGVIKREHEKDRYALSFFDKLDAPAEPTNCYILYLNESAPFPDNIEGH